MHEGFDVLLVSVEHFLGLWPLFATLFVKSPQAKRFMAKRYRLKKTCRKLKTQLDHIEPIDQNLLTISTVEPSHSLWVRPLTLS